MATTIHTAYNMIKVNVDGTYDASATSIDLDTGEQAKCPTPPYWMVWWDSTNYSNPFDDSNWEIVEVTAHNASDNITVVRGQQTTLGGKAASTKNTGGASYKMQNIFSAYEIERLRNRCAFSVYRTSVQSIPDITNEKIQFDTEDFDLTGDFNTTLFKFVAPRDMLLHVDLCVRMDSMGDGDHVAALIYVNTSQVALAYYQTGFGGSASDPSAFVSKTLSISANDEVFGYIRHNYGSARNLVGGSEHSFMTGYEVLPQ